MPQRPRNLREPVVDSLEVVDVDEAEREGLAALLGRHQLALESLVEMAVIAEPRQWVRQGKAHRTQSTVRRALVLGDREQRADERDRQYRRALPQHDEHQRRGRHERERDERRPRLRTKQRHVRHPTADRHDGRDQHDVDNVVRRCRDDDARDHRSGGVPGHRRDQRARGDRHERENRNVVGDANQRPVLGEVDE